MRDFYYSTDSDEHLENIGEKQEDQWDELTQLEMLEDLMDSWDDFMDNDHPCYTDDSAEQDYER